MPKDAEVFFEYQRDGKTVSLIIPVLTIVPIPLVHIDTIDIDFLSKISVTDSASNEDARILSVNASARPRPAGITCPKCKEFIEISIEDLLRRSIFRCKVCGLELTLNRFSSREALEALAQIQGEQEQLGAAKHRDSSGGHDDEIK